MEKRKRKFIGSTYFSEDLLIYINRWQEGFENPHHYHDFIEITIVEEGMGYHYNDDQVLSVTKGDLFIIPIDVSHVYRPSSTRSKEKLTVYNVLFDPKVIHHLLSENNLVDSTFIDWCQQLLTTKSINHMYLADKHESCLSLIRLMYYEFQQKQTGYSVVIQAKLRELLVNLYRIEQRIDSTNSKIAAYPIDEIIPYIDKHLHEALTLTDMAKLMIVSERHFLRLFKKYTNQTFTEYLQHKRIERSCDLLRSTDYTIKEISHLVGYSNTDYFRSLFVKKIGIPPQKYRKSSF